jgi:hypothetical protein
MYIKIISACLKVCIVVVILTLTQQVNSNNNDYYRALYLFAIVSLLTSSFKELENHVSK